MSQCWSPGKEGLAGRSQLEARATSKLSEAKEEGYG